MIKFKRWGNYSRQTVSKAKGHERSIFIRQDGNEVEVFHCEIDSLIMALLEVKEGKHEK